MECLRDVSRPEECVVYTLGLRRHVSDEGVVAGGISVTGGDIALWCRQVSVSPPRGYKCSEVSILFPQCYRVVAISRVENCLLGSAWDGSGLVEGGRTVVRLSRGMLVQGLEVYGPPERPVLLGAYHHSVAPGDGCAQGDLLEHAKADISVQSPLHLLLPVDWYQDRGVAGFWGGCWVYVESEGWARHHRQSLVFAYVEGAGRIRLE